MTVEYVQAKLLGTDFSHLEIPQDFFRRILSERLLLGRLVEDPPPIVAPCKDGVLIMFNYWAVPVGVAGLGISVPSKDLGDVPTLAEVWASAKKPMTLKAALLYFGFPEKS